MLKGCHGNETNSSHLYIITFCFYGNYRRILDHILLVTTVLLDR